MVAAAAASQPSHPPKYLVNRGVPPLPVGALSCVFPGGLSCKSVGRILGKKNQPIDDERMSLQTSLGRKTPVAKIANIHV